MIGYPCVRNVIKGTIMNNLMLERNFMEKKIMCVGHLGFISQRLIEELLWTGTGLHQLKLIDLKNGDDARKLKPADFEGVNTVFHLAAMPKVPMSIDRPKFTHSHNVNATLNVLDCARKAGVRRVVYSSSSSVYGNQETLPLTEDMNPDPMSPYAVQKLVGEYYCKVYADVFGLETVSLRYFNVYGEGMPLLGGYTAAIAQFLTQYENEEPLTVFGGDQTRDFTYVRDVAKANILAAKSNKVGKGEIINIGGGHAYSMKEIAESISSNIVYSPQRKGEPMHTLADISKAKELLDWSPEQDVIKWIKSRV